LIPTILQIGPVTISSLGVMMALGFFLGSFLVWQKGREEDLLMDGILLVVLAALVAARIGYVLLHWLEHIYLLNLVEQPGFSWLGALLGGVTALIFYCRKNKWDFYKLADLSVFGLILGLILGKIGFFLSQTAFDLSFLMEAFLLVFVYRLLVIFDKNYRTYEWYKDKRGEAKPGFLLFSFLISTSLIFLGAGAFRAWPQFFNLYQAGNLLIILVSLGLFYFRSGDRNLTISLPSFKTRRRENSRFKAGMEAK
jgi:prolipoprotein diacylglyceryltransferase